METPSTSSEDVSDIPTKKRRIAYEKSSDDLCMRPVDDVFQDNKLKKFYNYLKKRMAHLQLADSYSRNESKLQKLYENNYFIHYGYQRPDNLFLAFNARGLVINTEYNSPDAFPVTDLEDLRSSCKVVLLCPSLNSWWHEESAMLLKKHLEDLKTDSMVIAKDTKSTLNNFITKNEIAFDKIMNDRYKKLQARMMDDGRSGVFAMQIPNSREKKSKIGIPVHSIGKDGSIAKDEWTSLLPTSNFQCISVATLQGIKVTSGTVNFDIKIKALFYQRFSEENVDDVDISFNFNDN